MIAPLALLLPVCPVSDPLLALRLPIAAQAILVLLALLCLARALRQAARGGAPPEGDGNSLPKASSRTAASPLTQLTKESQ